jgi:16S rRNA (guanine(966)-N(2))-methyltransferase RsmD
MRIVAGEHRSRRLVVPPGRDVRPTSDRAREAVFASLGARVVDARVLDLFAGSGALGLEALSRGAASCRFVERDTQALGAIRENVEALGEHARATVERGDAMRVLRRAAAAGERYDLILVDPPYADAERLAGDLGALLPQVLADDGRIVLETGADAAIPVPGMVEGYNRRIAAARIIIMGVA